MACIFKLEHIAHDARHPIQDTRTMKVNRLPVVAAPHHSRILQKPAAMKAPMSGSREPEGVLTQLGHVVREAHSFNVPRMQPLQGWLLCSVR